MRRHRDGSQLVGRSVCDIVLEPQPNKVFERGAMRANADIADIARDVAANVGEDVVKDVCGAASVAGVAYGNPTAYIPTYMLYTYILLIN